MFAGLLQGGRGERINTQTEVQTRREAMINWRDTAEVCLIVLNDLGSEELKSYLSFTNLSHLVCLKETACSWCSIKYFNFTKSHWTDVWCSVAHCVWLTTNHHHRPADAARLPEKWDSGRAGAGRRDRGRHENCYQHRYLASLSLSLSPAAT